MKHGWEGGTECNCPCGRACSYYVVSIARTPQWSQVRAVSLEKACYTIGQLWLQFPASTRLHRREATRLDASSSDRTRACERARSLPSFLFHFDFPSRGSPSSSSFWLCRTVRQSIDQSKNLEYLHVPPPCMHLPRQYSLSCAKLFTCLRDPIMCGLNKTKRIKNLIPFTLYGLFDSDKIDERLMLTTQRFSGVSSSRT